MSHSELDTFNRLGRVPIEEFRRQFDQWKYATDIEGLTDDEVGELIANYLEGNGWTWTDFYNEGGDFLSNW